MMIRMAPGTSYPRHRHAAREECFVLQGELRVGDKQLRTGDFQVADRDSIHDVQSTETGCVLLIVSSQDDELV
jgi:anti-sigma factor ChrR (cupin superfamily)